MALKRISRKICLIIFVMQICLSTDAKSIDADTTEMMENSDSTMEITDLEQTTSDDIRPAANAKQGVVGWNSGSPDFNQGATQFNGGKIAGCVIGGCCCCGLLFCLLKACH